MKGAQFQSRRLSERDLDFVVEEAAPDFRDKANLKRLIVEDAAFRRGLLGDDKVFRKVMAEEDIVIRISPLLYFGILLRRALKELEKASHTVERVGSQVVAVFDTKQVASLFADETVVDYLADMMSSFTKIESYSMPVRVRKGIWRRLRFNDMDIDGLARFVETMEEPYKFGFYKRIADVCLFILGMFPEYAHFDYRYPFSGEVRPRIGRLTRRGMEDYEEEGKKYYKLAANHESAEELGLSGVLELLHGNFSAAKKPLNFVSERYLHFRKARLFGAEAQ